MSTYTIPGASGASDSLTGTAGNDWVNSSGGDDTIYGYGGNDTFNGQWGEEIIYGGAV